MPCPSFPIDDLRLTIRSRNALTRLETKSLPQLLLLRKGRLLKQKNLGVKSLFNIAGALQLFVDSEEFRFGLKAITEDSDREAMRAGLSSVPIQDLALSKFVASGWRVPDQVVADLRVPVQTLDLSYRAMSALNALSVETVEELLRISVEDLHSVGNCGRVTLAELRTKAYDYLAGRRPLPASGPTAGTKQFIEDLLARVGERDSSVLKDRYGLWDEIFETLQEIGDKFGLTRERVRQIESKSIRRLQDIARPEIKGFVQHKLDQYFMKHVSEGIVGDADLKAIFADDCTKEQAALGLKLLGDLIGSASDLFETFLIKPEEGVYVTSPKVASAYGGALRLMQEFLGSEQRPMTIEQLLDSVSSRCEKGRDFLAKVLSVSASFRIIRNELVVSSDWPAFKSKTTLALCIAAFQVFRRPMHFRELAAKIAEMNPEIGSINERTVQNELVRRSDLFANIAEGKYAPVEWGIKRPPYLKDALIQVLSGSSYPLPYWHIEQQMQAIAAYKPTSIRMTLDLNPAVFRKYENDQYSLRKEAARRRETP